MNNDITLAEHFRLLFAFGGREDGASFWPYAALVFGILTTLNILMVLPMLMAVGSIMEPGMPPDVSNFMIYFAAMTGLGILLYAAAVVRRLRDTGRSPMWALLPLPFAIGSALGMMQAFTSPFDFLPPDMTMLQLSIACNALETLSVVVLIFLLTLRSASPSRATGKPAIPVYHEE
ncbi:MAG: DUF805 domain-containing protein [Sphingomicrobium sp.]